MHISKLVLSVILSITLFTQASWAQMASTEVLFEHAVKVSPKEKVIQFTAREDVAKILGQMDVDPKMIEERVASMTDDEVLEIAYQIDTLPAGGSSIIGAVVFVFVLLLVTDILGFTKVFNFTRTVR